MSGIEQPTSAEGDGVPADAATATLNRAAGDSLGVTLFLGADDLRALGVEGADELAYWVATEGAIAVLPRGSDD